MASASRAYDAADGKVAALTSQLDEKRVSQRALAQVELLNQQISALRQIAALEDALNASVARQGKLRQDRRPRQALNVALAQRACRNSPATAPTSSPARNPVAAFRHSSPADRFVFQSEVLFDLGQADVNPAGQGELGQARRSAAVPKARSPLEIAWVLRVDGHTDARPLSGTGRFRDNRTVVGARHLGRQVSDQQGHLAQPFVAVLLGEFQPLEAGDSDEVNARNRRIELKLTER